jgi:hypothetical protein
VVAACAASARPHGRKFTRSSGLNTTSPHSEYQAPLGTNGWSIADAIETHALSHNMRYGKRMTKPPLPRYIADIRLVVEISGEDEADAEQRLAAVQDFIETRLGRTTFHRLAGKPSLAQCPDVISEVVPT